MGKDHKSMEGPIYENYKAVLDSKSTDETLVRSVCSFVLVSNHIYVAKSKIKIICRHYMQVGSHDTRGVVIHSRGNNMLSLEPFFVILVI